LSICIFIFIEDKLRYIGEVKGLLRRSEGNFIYDFLLSEWPCTEIGLACDHQWFHVIEEAGMKVQDLLKAKKNGAVLTVRPEDTILNLLHRLRVEGVGAMVVSRDGNSLDGIISERDVVRALAVDGAKVLSFLVSDLMTKSVITCSPEDSIANVGRMMTARRVRHLPVGDADGRLVGLISIGDVLKHRIDEIEFEATVLRDLAIASR
jgi:CBS domain-containing protein